MTNYTKHLPNTLYRAEQVRELDRIAIEENNIPGYLLMSKAGEASFKAIQAHWPMCKTLVIYCGVGNNGGDGYVIAALAYKAGFSVTVLTVGDVAKLSNDALLAKDAAVAVGVSINAFDASKHSVHHAPDKDDAHECVVVDALLGTGLKGDVRGESVRAIEAMNAAGYPICAVDIPSGLCADTGRVLGGAVNACVTVSFIGLKQGLLTGSGPQQCGELFFAGLDVPTTVYQQLTASTTRLHRSHINGVLSQRNRGAHKGNFGHVVVIGGDHGMGGAVMMASEAVGYVGAGMVTVLTRAEHISALLSRHPECMALDPDTCSATTDEILAKATVIVAGPGIGRGAWAASLLQKALSADVPLVLDADGLNFLASPVGKTFQQRGNWVLTPHPGEAARLLECQVSDIESDRFDSVRRLSERFSASAVLKGAGTLIASECSESDIENNTLTRLANVGNPGMASAGMGDVLSGVIGGLLAQHLTLDEAACVGVWLHGKAAECAVKESGERGLRATDLFPYIRRLVNGKQKLCKH